MMREMRKEEEVELYLNARKSHVGPYRVWLFSCKMIRTRDFIIINFFFGKILRTWKGKRTGLRPELGRNIHDITLTFLAIHALGGDAPLAIRIILLV